MAAYATQPDIVARYGPNALLMASDRDDDQKQDTDTVAAALDDATGEINAWISARYDLPLSEVPAVLVECCVDIAFYRLHFLHSTLTDEIKERYQQCIELMQAIAAGEASLGLDDPPVSIGGAATMVGPPRLFTRDTMRNI
jgi:phage gp36-like protein